MKQRRNTGSASVEASLVIPVFLLAMLRLFLCFQSVLAEVQVYEAAAETVEYMSETASAGVCDAAVAYLRFPRYIDEKKTVKQYVKYGESGVCFPGSTMDEEDYVVLRTSYELKYLGPRTFTIRKRAYTGAVWTDTDSEAESGKDAYVYVTDRQSVYHVTRSCSYLTLDIRMSSLQEAKADGYAACAFCGKELRGEQVYVTEDGDCYHSSLRCSGLTRTVYRKKKSEVTGLGACSRCGNRE